MLTNEGFQGVSNCYVFKSRLQEYAQKIGLPTPVYETIKEGPSHEPSFRSTVIVNDVRYDSLPGFFNRKAAEQSAAEVALSELAKASEFNQSISQPVHETGLCKNLLQEYAQKMNYAIPLYQCQKDETPGRVSLFSCTVEIGGIRYIGAAAKTKKEAEIKAARTALLAIQSSTSQLSDKSVHKTQLTVIPSKKRGTELAALNEETENVPKAKKPRFTRRMLKRQQLGDKAGNSQVENVGSSRTFIDANGSELNQANGHGVQEAGLGPLAMEAIRNPQDGRSDGSVNEKGTPAEEGTLAIEVNGHGVQEAGLGPLAVEAVRNPQDGRSDVSANEEVIPIGEGALAIEIESMGNPENVRLDVSANEKEISAGEGALVIEANGHGVQEAGLGPLAMEAIRNPQDGRSDVSKNEKEIPAGEGALAIESTGNPQNVRLDVSANETEISAGEVVLAIEANGHGFQEAGSGPLAMEAIRNPQDGSSDVSANEKEIPAGEGALAIESTGNPQNVRLDACANEKEISTGEGALANQVNGICDNGQLTALSPNQSNDGNLDVGTSSVFSGDMTALTKEVNGVTGVASVGDNSTMGQIETSSVQLA
nr:double-stranded RNA-binding protein 1-like [Quercus suber]